MNLRKLLGLALTVGLPNCLSNPIVPRDSGEAVVRNLLQLSPGTWLENLVQRPNGSFLLTELTGPNIWEVNPYVKDANSSARIIAKVPSATSLLGITETGRDVYAFIAGNISVGANAGVVPGSWSVWSIDLSSKTSTSPEPSLIAKIPSAELLNGMDYIPKAHSVLIADSILSVIYKLDLTTGQSSVAINDTLMTKCAEPLGVNGLKYHPPSSSVYWTNCLCGTLARTLIDPSTALPTANSTLIASAHTFLDDFDLDHNATAYVAAGTTNQILKITPDDGTITVVAGNLNSSAIAEPAAVRIGRSNRKDTYRHHPDHDFYLPYGQTQGSQMLYVSTAGALQSPINGTTVVGGQMLAIDLGS